MTVQELYEKLTSERFKDVEHGDLFYNFFVFQYPANKEYEMRKDIIDFKARLIRPTNYVNVLTLDLFKEFCTFLEGIPFGNKYPSFLQYMFDKEQKDPAAVTKALTIKANSREFLEYIHNRIMEHKKQEGDCETPYVFVYGIGSMYPYMRTSTFLSKYEEFNKTNQYKIILFYPGHRVENSFSLFGRIHDHNTYRAHLLINDN